VPMASGKEGLQLGGEGISALPDHLRGDGFPGDPSATTSSGPLKHPIAPQRRGHPIH